VIKSVLVAVDGSENSSRALDFALDLADKYGATLTILNVSESPPMGVVPFEPVTVSGDRAKELNPKLLISTKLREGDPALEIIAEAKEGKFGILVIGHRGSSRVREIFMGKISEKVSHLTPCPVVIVK
jgi:nucleotide-binding universal stress UspA family protein